MYLKIYLKSIQFQLLQQQRMLDFFRTNFPRIWVIICVFFFEFRVLKKSLKANVNKLFHIAYILMYNRKARKK